MSMFSFRKKPPESFEFFIEAAFALRDGGAVTAGRMISGSLRQGSEVLCTPPEGEPFACVVQSIEQPDPERRGEFLHPEEARSGGRYAFRIPDRRGEDFSTGAKLTPLPSRWNAPSKEPENGPQ